MLFKFWNLKYWRKPWFSRYSWHCHGFSCVPWALRAYFHPSSYLPSENWLLSTFRKEQDQESSLAHNFESSWRMRNNEVWLCVCVCVCVCNHFRTPFIWLVEFCQFPWGLSPRPLLSGSPRTVYHPPSLETQPSTRPFSRWSFMKHLLNTCYDPGPLEVSR